MIVPSSALFFALRFIVHAERAKRRHAAAPHGATFWPLHTAREACSAARILAPLPPGTVVETMRRRVFALIVWAASEGVPIAFDPHGQNGPEVVEGRVVFGVGSASTWHGGR